MQFSDPAVIQLAKFEKADETIPVCLIGLDKAYTLAGNVSRFDFGICMAAFDGEQVHQSGRFNAEVSEKTFTLYRADNQAQFNYSLKRFETISARYDRLGTGHSRRVRRTGSPPRFSSKLVPLQ